jgi:hypothetical protein
MRPDVTYAQMCDLIARLAFSPVIITETNSYYPLKSSEQLKEISKRVQYLEEAVSEFVGFSLEAKRMITHGGKLYGTIKPYHPNTNTVR